ncbi:MAG: DUF4214 domain-containing protein [Pseudomonadota bacterium]
MATLRRSVENIAWVAGISLATGEEVSLAALAGDNVSVGQAGSSLELSWGIDRGFASNAFDFSSIRVGGALVRDRFFDDAFSVPLFSPLVFNGVGGIADFGGAILEFDVVVREDGEAQELAERLPVRLRFDWQDTVSSTEETEAPDALTVTVLSAPDGQRFGLDILGFGTGDTSSLDPVLIEERSDDGPGTLQAMVRVLDDQPPALPDYGVASLPDARLIEGPVIGGRAFTWLAGEEIALSQDVGNLGGASGALVALDFELVRVDERGFITKVIPVGTLDPVPQAVPPGEIREFSSTLVVDQALLNQAGLYKLRAEVNPGAGRVPESDISNNFLTTDELPTVLISNRSLIDLAEEAIGTAEDDTLTTTGTTGKTVDGGEGRDTAALLEAFSEPFARTIALFEGGSSAPRLQSPALALAPDEAVVLTDTRTGIADTYISVERIAFLDGVFVFDLPGDEVPFVYRLYSAAFARTPDEPGLRFWNGERIGGLGDEAMAGAFVSSPEFADKFGADLTDEEFIGALYDNVLLREPDAGGEAFWLDAFASGRLDRVDMLLAFSDSAENVERNEENYDVGVWVV